MKRQGTRGQARALRKEQAWHKRMELTNRNGLLGPRVDRIRSCRRMHTTSLKHGRLRSPMAAHGVRKTEAWLHEHREQPTQPRETETRSAGNSRLVCGASSANDVPATSTIEEREREGGLRNSIRLRSLRSHARRAPRGRRSGVARAQLGVCAPLGLGAAWAPLGRCSSVAPMSLGHRWGYPGGLRSGSFAGAKLGVFRGFARPSLCRRSGCAWPPLRKSVH